MAKTKDEIENIKAVLLYMLSKQKTMHRIKLYKLLYYAQREYLVKYGLPLFPETFRAYPHGPVPSVIRKVISIEENHADFQRDLTIFENCLSIKDNGDVEALQLPNLDELAIAATKTLDSIWEQYGCLSPEKLEDMSHDEWWENAKKRALDDPEQNIMSKIEIARSGKANENTIAYIRDNELFDRLVAL